jgi:hypothetical protein
MRRIYSLCFIIVVLLFASCEKSSSGADATANALSPGGTGVGGSLAKFTISGNYIYAVSSHFLYTVDITNPSQPVNVGKSALNYDMETIYPYKNQLFIGSRTGLYVYSLDTPSAPKLIGEAKHGRSCDPVVANDTVSYSTLKGSTICGPATSGLYVYDIKNINQPDLKKLITINEPVGLGMADSALYVCCAGEGLKVYSIKNAYNPVEIKTISGSNFTDLIPYNNILICWVADGISLYDITNRLQPVFIRKVMN